MKKPLIRWLVAALVLILVGLLLGAGTILVAGMPFVDEYAVTTTTHGEQITTIRADLRAGSIRLLPTTADAITVTVIDDAAVSLIEVSEAGDTLVITRRLPVEDLHDIRTWINFSRRPTYDVEIAIPADFLLDLDLDTTSGDIVCDSLTFARVSLETGSGSISLDDCTVNTGLDACSTSGGITLDGLFCYANIRLSTSSGDIALDGLNCRGDLTESGASGSLRLRGTNNVSGVAELLRRSGDIEIDCLRAGNAIRLAASSGRILVTDLLVAPAVSAQTSSGLISIKLLDADTVRLKSDAGDIVANTLHPRNHFVLSVLTASGHITLHNDTGPTAHGSRALDATTASGDITLGFAPSD